MRENDGENPEVGTESISSDSEIKAEIKAEDKKEKQKNKRMDFISKIICVVLATVIWFYVMQVDSPQYEHTFEDVEIKLSGSETLEKERGLSVYSGYGRTVDITVSGKKSVVGRQTSDDIRVTAELSEINTAGNYEIALNISLPDGLELVEAEYDKIDVYVDERASATVLLRSRLTGFTQSSEFEYGEPTTDVDSIVVTGPKSEIENVDYALVSVDFSGMGIIDRTTSATRSVSLVGKDGSTVDNPYIRLSRSEALVTLPVYTEKLVELRVNWYNGFFNETNTNVDISPSEIKVKGDPASLENMDYITFATIDEKTVDGSFIKSYTVESGNDYTIVGTNEVRLSVTLVGTATKTFRVTDFEVEAGKNKVRVLDEFIEVTLRGTPAVLDSVEDGDITAKLDASKFDSDYSGNVQSEVEIVVNGVHDSPVYEIGQYTVNIRVN